MYSLGGLGRERGFCSIGDRGGRGRDRGWGREGSGLWVGGWSGGCPWFRLLGGRGVEVEGFGGFCVLGRSLD